MPFNIYLDDKLTHKGVSSPYALSGLNPATEHKLSVTEVVNGVESPKWNGKLITKQIVKADLVTFLRYGYDVIEGDTFRVEPIALPWNATKRDEITTKPKSENDIIREDSNGVFTAMKVGEVNLVADVEFLEENAEINEATINVLPMGTTPKYPTEFGLGNWTGNGGYSNVIDVAKYDIAFVQFDYRGQSNQHDWRIDITEGHDKVELVNNGRRVKAKAVGQAKGVLYYVSNPDQKVTVYFNVNNKPVDFILDKTVIDEAVGSTGDIKITYIPQGSETEYKPYVEVKDDSVVKVWFDETDKSILKYEVIGKGYSEVFITVSNSTRYLSVTGK